MKMAKNIEALNAQQVFLNFQQDPPHPTYSTPAPWEAPPLQFSTRKLAKSKADMSPAELASEARASGRSAPTHAADVFFTDGSVDTTTGTAAAAVHHNEFAALYRLPDNSSTLQTELLAILRALQLAVPRDINVTIHTDSLGAIQAIQTVSPKDNVNLITSVLATAKNIHDSGRHVHLNWVPSHTGIPGNEAADLAAKEALNLPQVTAPIPPSITHIKASIRRVSHEHALTCLRPWITNPTSSAHWYNTTRTNTTPFPRNIGRKTRNALHRVRIGYKCLAEIKGTLPLACCHCDAETVSPLKHYVMDCPATSDMLARSHAAAKDVIANTSHDALARLVTHHPPPR
ncbi:Gag-Pol polyprotein [Chionoecetes opilio]|uniref:ribonuclease H n=1 Tax=Chionoecetes opilio TaxID=41210 RepID=A0A8J5CMW0_CHIOP|nr:Gag-Pol polyprotein [Chionoecetes opilio]